MTLPTVEPIRDEDLPRFCTFLSEHLSRDRSAAEWTKAFTQSWYPGKPNNGFLIRHEGHIVGGIGAIYAERPVRGRLERFCNITSWCVLDAFRAQSMRLAMALTGQPGFHFTDLTPTEVVSKTLQFLKFKPMNERQAIWPNLPRPFAAWAGVRVVSDPEAFLRYHGALGSHLLVHHGLLYTRVESRLLPRLPRLRVELSGYRNKVFKSDTLTAADMSNLYSELVALDL